MHKLHNSIRKTVNTIDTRCLRDLHGLRQSNDRLLPSNFLLTISSNSCFLFEADRIKQSREIKSTNSFSLAFPVNGIYFYTCTVLLVIIRDTLSSFPLFCFASVFLFFSLAIWRIYNCV